MSDLTTIGRYEILGEIGRGAMGVVYKARDPVMDRVVAVKTVQSLALSGPQAQQYRDRFYREAQAAARLSHPGIVTVYDAGEQDGMPYLVMEYLQGRTLGSALDGGERFTFDRVAGLGQQLAEALGYAHRNGVVHRDIKPANIFLWAPDRDAPERAKITDLGIAKLTASQITTTGQLLGTPSFMPPEQFIGVPVDGRADLFSLGVILYWMATGDKPFAGDTITAVSYKIVHMQTIPPRKLNPTVPEGLESIIMMCLQKDPAQRYQNGEALAQDLAAFLAGGIVCAPPYVAPIGSSDVTVTVRDESGRAQSGQTPPLTSRAPQLVSRTPPLPATSSAETIAGPTMVSPVTPPQAPEPASAPARRRSGRTLRLALEAAGIVVLLIAVVTAIDHRRPKTTPTPATAGSPAAAKNSSATGPGAPATGAGDSGAMPTTSPAEIATAAASETQPPHAASTEDASLEKRADVTAPAKTETARRHERAATLKPKATLTLPSVATAPIVPPASNLELTPPATPKNPVTSPPAKTAAPLPVLTPDSGARVHFDVGHLPDSLGFVVLMDGKPFYTRKPGQESDQLLPPGEHEFQVIAATGAVKLGQSNTVRGEFKVKKKKTLRIELRDNTTGNTMKKDAKLYDDAADYVLTLK